MTDNEIIKALNCCGNQMYSCTDKDCKAKTLGSAVDLINRQKAEIERLKAVRNAELDTIHTLGDDYEKALEEINRLKAEIERLQHYKQSYEDLKAEHLETIKAIKQDKTEAVKEFWIKLKNYCDSEVQFDSTADEYAFERFGNLILKEKVGAEK